MLTLFLIGVAIAAAICCFENNTDDRQHEQDFEEAYTKALDAALRKHLSQ